MAHRLTGLALASLVGAGLLASHASPAQTTTPETPVGTFLSEDHLSATDSFGPPFGFALAVAIEGKTAFVGAPWYSDTTQVNSEGNPITQGIVEVYTSDATGAHWTLTGSLQPVVPALDTFFGATVAASGDRLAIGANTQIQLYEKRHGQWTPTTTIATAVAPSTLVFVGNTLTYSVTGTGVYVYEIGERCKPRLVQTLKPSSSDTGRYGNQVALKGELLVVGSPGGATSGQAYVYSRDGLRWHLEQTLQSPTGDAGSEFGSGVAIAHHSIIVGAPGEDVVGQVGYFTYSLGEAFVFRKSHGVWAETQAIQDSGSSYFGEVIAAGGGRVVVSSPGTLDPLSGYFAPSYIYRWEGDMLVSDGTGVTAEALDVSHNRIIIGQNFDGRGGFFEAAQVLTYPKPGTDD